MFRIMYERKGADGKSVLSFGQNSKFPRIEIAENAVDLRWKSRDEQTVSIRVVGKDGYIWYERKSDD